MSLEIAVEMSVKLLEKIANSDNEINLLYFMGCLPGGVTKAQLRDMWGHGSLTDQCLEKLQKFPFFETGLDTDLSEIKEYEKIMLTPTMINYLENNTHNENRQSFMQQII